jgi:YVTN family beta-propeller protein
LVRDLLFNANGTKGYTAMWDEKAVIVFNPNTWDVVAKIDTGRAPFFGVCPVWLAISPDGRWLYALGEESDNVVIIDTTSNKVVGTVRVGKPYPQFLPMTLKNAQPSTTISGIVTDTSGNPLANIRDNAKYIEFGCSFGFGSSDSDGTFQVNVPAGTYDLSFCKENQCYTVIKGRLISASVNLGDVLFAEAP